jgi:hypothetical protein
MRTQLYLAVSFLKVVRVVCACLHQYVVHRGSRHTALNGEIAFRTLGVHLICITGLTRISLGEEQSNCKQQYHQRRFSCHGYILFPLRFACELSK